MPGMCVLLLVMAPLVGPPAPRDTLQVLRSWQQEPRQALGQAGGSPYPLLMLADGISTELRGWRGDINPLVSTREGALGILLRAGYFAGAAWVLNQGERRLPRWAQAIMWAWVGAVEERMIADNVAVWTWIEGRRR